MKQIKSLIFNFDQFIKIDLSDYKVQSFNIPEFGVPNAYSELPEKILSIKHFSNSYFGINFESDVKKFLLKKDIKNIFSNISPNNNQYKNYYEDTCFSYLYYILKNNKLSSITKAEYDYLISMCPHFAIYLIMHVEKDEEVKKNLENIILNHHQFTILVYYAIRYKTGPWKELEKTEKYKKAESTSQIQAKMTYLQKNVINYGINFLRKTLEQIFTEMLENKTYKDDLQVIFKNNPINDTINILFKNQYFKQLDDYIHDNHYELYYVYEFLKRTFNK